MSRSCSTGSAAAMPSRWLTSEPAPEPRAATRMPISRTSATTWPTVRKYEAKPSPSMIRSSWSSRAQYSGSRSWPSRTIPAAQRERSTRSAVRAPAPTTSGSGKCTCPSPRSSSGSTAQPAAVSSVARSSRWASPRANPAASMTRSAVRAMSPASFSQRSPLSRPPASRTSIGTSRRAESRTSATSPWPGSA